MLTPNLKISASWSQTDLTFASGRGHLILTLSVPVEWQHGDLLPPLRQYSSPGNKESYQRAQLPNAWQVGVGHPDHSCISMNPRISMGGNPSVELPPTEQTLGPYLGWCTSRSETPVRGTYESCHSMSEDGGMPPLQESSPILPNLLASYPTTLPFFWSVLQGPKPYSLWGGVVPSPSIGYEYL